MTDDEENKINIIELKENISRQEYNLQQNFINQNTINLGNYIQFYTKHINKSSLSDLFKINFPVCVLSCLD